ncbi:MAG: acetyl-CoA acetyltransferase [Spirochaetes bacterium DG_61]|jgi:acetyl-CoA C-acetyltransferase|nr:MAG: acetyl-CoA acetyltransferase [Spirochaetes bacterium DG_61]
MKSRVYILGGYQTDFARNWSREGKGIQAMINEVMAGAFADTDIDPGDIQSIHVGNFAGELYTMQAHFGALTVNYDPALRGLPTARHEAACASGSIAALMARTEIEADIHDLILVVGVELMKSVDSKIGGNYLGTAAWYEKECVGIEFPFPKLFDRLYDVYDEIYGVKYEHLAQIATVNYENAKKNPKAQTRNWYMNKKHACSSGEYNRTIGRRLRATDCSQVTDGAAALFLASHKYAEGYAKKHNLNLSKIPYIQGWGHATAPIRFSDKAEEAKKSQYVLPHTRKAILEAFQRSNIHGVEDISCIETHDCFTITEYAAIEHFGLTKPGEGFKAIEDGTIELNGSCPINPSGGLIGGGHPVGATGTRQLLDAYLQVSGKAGDYQVAGAKRVATLNIGGSATTNVVHILGSDTNGS